CLMQPGSGWRKLRGWKAKSMSASTPRKRLNQSSSIGTNCGLPNGPALTVRRYREEGEVLAILSFFTLPCDRSKTHQLLLVRAGASRRSRPTRYRRTQIAVNG